MKALSDKDIDLEADTEYKVFFNYGIFNDKDDTNMNNLKGAISINPEPRTILIMAAETARNIVLPLVTLLASYSTF